jgi:hypothetical protein
MKSRQGYAFGGRKRVFLAINEILCINLVILSHHGVRPDGAGEEK